METLRIVEMYDFQSYQWVVIPFAALKVDVFFRMWEPDGTPVSFGSQQEFKVTKDAYLNSDGVWTVEFLEDTK